MQPVIIYTSQMCGFCHAAKRLLESKGVDFEEINVGRDPALRQEMMARANGGHTVPQIFIGDRHVGGCDDLYALERGGRLDALLTGEAMRVGLVQRNSGDDPLANLAPTRALLRKAAGAGAEFVMTPEATNFVSMDRARGQAVLHREAEDPTLAALREEARALGVWLLIGSLALKTGAADGRLANRSFLIEPGGGVVARYDKIHMFDVDIDAAESYRESAGYRPGDRAVLARTPFGGIGMSICYDLRFAALYRALARAGASILSVPAAFSPVTGKAHWQVLLRARAIENGAFVLAPAQCGDHGGGRRTHGHSLAVAPWGEVLADGGEDPGVSLVDLDLDQVGQARRRVPSLSHDRPFAGPQ